MSDSRLPDFSDPPVREVALSIQFEELPALRSIQIAELWLRKYKDRLPEIEEHATVDPSIERFGGRIPSRPSIRFQAWDSPPVPRYWFIGGSEVVQVQQDRFVCSWRRADDKEAYPRFKQVVEMFRKDVQIFKDWVKEKNLGEVRPTQCEVTYVNLVSAAKDGESPHGKVEQFVSAWTGKYSDDFLPAAEDVIINSRYVMGDEVNPLGRLHVSIAPGYDKKSEEPVHILTLAARGAPLSEGLEGVYAFFEKGREWIVRGFTSFTSREMHQTWGRRDDR